MTKLVLQNEFLFPCGSTSCSSLCSKVFKRKIIENNGLRFRTDFSIGEDQLFIFSYAMHIQSISSIDALLYNVDVSNENSLSRKGRHYLTGQLMEVNRRMYAAYHATEHSPESAHYYEAGLAWMTYRSAYSCCKELLKFNCSAKQRRREIRKTLQVVPRGKNQACRLEVLVYCLAGADEMESNDRFVDML